MNATPLTHDARGPAARGPAVTITVEQAQAQGVSPKSLRDVAKWNARYANRERGAARDRLLGQADALNETARELDAANDNRRR